MNKTVNLELYGERDAKMQAIMVMGFMLTHLALKDLEDGKVEKDPYDQFRKALAFMEEEGDDE